jgi:putative transposase
MTKAALEIACAKHGCTSPMFTLMPDHAHILLLGRSEDSNLLKAIDYVKWRTGCQFTSRKMAVRWQEGYWDSIAKGVEGWAGHALYTALNPCRAGLAQHPEDWAYSGSVGYEFNEVLQDAIESKL